MPRKSPPSLDLKYLANSNCAPHQCLSRLTEPRGFVGNSRPENLKCQGAATLSFTSSSKDLIHGVCLDRRKIPGTFSIIGSAIWLVSLAGCGGTAVLWTRRRKVST